MNRFGHIDLRVADLASALRFYEELMPALGFTERYHGEAWKVWASTDPLPGTAYFGITEEVDRVAAVARRAGASDLGGPKPMPYAPGYYAAFFADPSGNRLEVYVRPE